MPGVGGDLKRELKERLASLLVMGGAGLGWIAGATCSHLLNPYAWYRFLEPQGSTSI